MLISKKNIKNIKPGPGVIFPSENLFELPEKVIQFGTGVLLRGLPDYFIDKANRKRIFNGRIVVVKSTASGDINEFAQQDSIYTLCERGIEDGKNVDNIAVISSISRILSANNEWNAILQCAHNQDIQVIISNTTEIGIVFLKENIFTGIPASFPGKLLAFLFERYKAFNGNETSGLVIIPTELIPDNGKKLKTIILDLAEYNLLDKKFKHWINESNYFCTSLVDRIVPGKLSTEDKAIVEKKTGYSDKLMIMAEPYRLWVIESDDKKVSEILSFSKADDGVVITNDIEKYRDLKLRLLNGPHTFTAGLAFLAGFRTVKEAMNNTYLRGYIKNLMINEIVPAISGKNISFEEGFQFAEKVLDRFCNPFLEHQWLSITVQYTSKMRMRNVPALIQHYKRSNIAPEYMALGFAGFLFFMKSAKTPEGRFEGELNNTSYPIIDDHADYFFEKWKKADIEEIVQSVLSDEQMWGINLAALNGFADSVKQNLLWLEQQGILQTIKKFQLNKIEAS